MTVTCTLFKLVGVIYSWGQFHKTFFAKRKVAGEQKLCCPISPMPKTPNFKLKLAHFLPKSCSPFAHFVRQKKDLILFEKKRVF